MDSVDQTALQSASLVSHLINASRHWVCVCVCMCACQIWLIKCDFKFRFVGASIQVPCKSPPHVHTHTPVLQVLLLILVTGSPSRGGGAKILLQPGHSREITKSVPDGILYVQWQHPILNSVHEDVYSRLYRLYTDTCVESFMLVGT